MNSEGARQNIGSELRQPWLGARIMPRDVHNPQRVGAIAFHFLNI
jgi:hypothetical protein